MIKSMKHDKPTGMIKSIKHPNQKVLFVAAPQSGTTTGGAPCPLSPGHPHAVNWRKFFSSHFDLVFDRDINDLDISSQGSLLSLSSLPNKMLQQIPFLTFSLVLQLS